MAMGFSKTCLQNLRLTVHTFIFSTRSPSVILFLWICGGGREREMLKKGKIDDEVAKLKYSSSSLLFSFPFKNNQIINSRLKQPLGHVC